MTVQAKIPGARVKASVAKLLASRTHRELLSRLASK